MSSNHNEVVLKLNNTQLPTVEQEEPEVSSVGHRTSVEGIQDMNELTVSTEA